MSTLCIKAVLFTNSIVCVNVPCRSYTSKPSFTGQDTRCTDWYIESIRSGRWDGLVSLVLVFWHSSRQNCYIYSLCIYIYMCVRARVYVYVHVREKERGREKKKKWIWDLKKNIHFRVESKRHKKPNRARTQTWIWQSLQRCKLLNAQVSMTSYVKRTSPTNDAKEAKEHHDES